MGEVRGQSEGAQSFITLPWHDACSNTPLAAVGRVPKSDKVTLALFPCASAPHRSDHTASSTSASQQHSPVTGRTRGEPEQPAGINHSLADSRCQMVIALRLSLNPFFFVCNCGSISLAWKH